MPTPKTLIVFVLLLLSPMAQADEKPEDPPAKDSKSSPRFVAPLVSSDPKISTAAGALAGYVHEFDEESPPSNYFNQLRYIRGQFSFWGDLRTFWFNRIQVKWTWCARSI